MECMQHDESQLERKAGDVRAETQGTSHWWKNLGDKPVTSLSFDILHDKGDHNM